MQGRKTVVSVVGTRPNMMKMSPVLRELRRRPQSFESILVHTGQHYDHNMWRVFLDELDVGEPDVVLTVGSGSHARQTARTMELLDAVLDDAAPDVVLVPGDVNSTLAAALVASKRAIAVGHIESGLRSFDRAMPEEINRVLTDQISDLLFIHSPEARFNLIREGLPQERIHFVGNTMIDTLVQVRDRVRERDVAARLGLTPGAYVLVTLHRPALVDGPLLRTVMEQLERLSRAFVVVFPIHPRTRSALTRVGVTPDSQRLMLLEPLGYFDFLGLEMDAAAVLTDSGGVQEETTYLGVPCFTLRDNTERPVTLSQGTNTLLGLAPERIAEMPAALGRVRETRTPDLWDGSAAQRIVDVLERPITLRERPSSAIALEDGRDIGRSAA